MDVEEVKDSIAYCGLVCKFCHVADRCSGCRSENNCCGKRLSESGCYQYTCCQERKFYGCWECLDFPCEQDMFSDTHDIRLRAFVRCAKEEGFSQLAIYVIKNQQNGIIYGHNRDYDHLGSEEAVLKLLRNGRKGKDI
jgi:hypothetical protein